MSVCLSLFITVDHRCCLIANLILKVIVHIQNTDLRLEVILSGGKGRGGGGKAYGAGG